MPPKLSQKQTVIVNIGDKVIKKKKRKRRKRTTATRRGGEAIQYPIGAQASFNPLQQITLAQSARELQLQSLANTNNQGHNNLLTDGRDSEIQRITAERDQGLKLLEQQRSAQAALPSARPPSASIMASARDMSAQPDVRPEFQEEQQQRKARLAMLRREGEIRRGFFGGAEEVKDDKPSHPFKPINIPREAPPPLPPRPVEKPFKPMNKPRQASPEKPPRPTEPPSKPSRPTEPPPKPDRPPPEPPAKPPRVAEAKVAPPLPPRPYTEAPPTYNPNRPAEAKDAPPPLPSREKSTKAREAAEKREEAKAKREEIAMEKRVLAARKKVEVKAERDAEKAAAKAERDAVKAELKATRDEAKAKKAEVRGEIAAIRAATKMAKLPPPPPPPPPPKPPRDESPPPSISTRLPTQHTPTSIEPLGTLLGPPKPSRPLTRPHSPPPPEGTIRPRVRSPPPPLPPLAPLQLPPPSPKLPVVARSPRKSPRSPASSPKPLVIQRPSPKPPLSPKPPVIAREPTPPRPLAPAPPPLPPAPPPIPPPPKRETIEDFMTGGFKMGQTKTQNPIQKQTLKAKAEHKTGKLETEEDKINKIWERYSASTEREAKRRQDIKDKQKELLSGTIKSRKAASVGRSEIESIKSPADARLARLSKELDDELFGGTTLNPTKQAGSKLSSKMSKMSPEKEPSISRPSQSLDRVQEVPKAVPRTQVKLKKETPPTPVAPIIKRSIPERSPSRQRPPPVARKRIVSVDTGLKTTASFTSPIITADKPISLTPQKQRGASPPRKREFYNMSPLEGAEESFTIL